MSFFLNCEWYPPADAGLMDRIEQIVRLLERQETVAVMGRNWYRQGRSKREALSKPLSQAKLTDVRSWGREKFIYEEAGRKVEVIQHWLGVWNGRDAPDGASLSVEIHEPMRGMDFVVFRGPELDSLKDKWRHVLAWGEAVSHHLGGWSLVSSNQLIDWARAEGLERADMAGYAAFHSRDGRSIVYATTWAEVIAPDRERVQDFIRRYRATDVD